MSTAPTSLTRFLMIAAAAAGWGWSQTNQATALVLSDPVHHQDWPAKEAMVVEHPNGTLFVSGYGGGSLRQRPLLWKSRDHGGTWSRVNVGTEADGALGNSDVDLAVAPDGTLYFASLIWNGVAGGEGTGVAMGVSRDGGDTWSWTMMSKDTFSDRPWVKVAPDGVAHVIWNDGNGVLYRQSRDRGATWSEASRVHDQGGSSHLSVGPNGELAVRIAPFSAGGRKYHEGVDLIATSLDSGKTWRNRPAPGEREWTEKGNRPVPRWVEPVAWDSQGALYSFWTNLKGLWLARSRDKGETWKIWQLAESKDVCYYPYLVAGRRAGELGGSWFCGKDSALEAHVALFQANDSDAAPRMIQSPPFRTDSWTPFFGPANRTPVTRAPSGEYLGTIFLRGGGLGVVSGMFNIQEKHAGFSWWKADLR